ncbi:hypothetical protein R1sor_004380 [Riccia sorocarpa]|uniref:Uncharacterized protein n=1 Tax=Riccia sorocarpa TaxID=122646 RepID=A0ABD3HKK4_9MARC
MRSAPSLPQISLTLQRNANRGLDRANLRDLCASAATRRATLSQPMTVAESQESSRAVTPASRDATSSPGLSGLNSGGSAAQGSELPVGWSLAGHVNLVYSLPELLVSNKSESGRELGDQALLRCQIVGNALVVYGAVTGGSVHRLSLSAKKFLLEDVASRATRSGSEAPEVASSSGRSAVSDLSNKEFAFRDIFGLWKDAKRFALPSFTDCHM